MRRKGEPESSLALRRGSSCGIIGREKEDPILQSFRFKTPLLLSAFLLAGLAAEARAGFHYKATTRTESTAGRGMGDVKVEGWVEGDKAKVEFRESGNPVFPKGGYLITKDGGQSMFLVDPSEKTYMRFDLRAMMGAAGGMMEGMGPLLKFDVSNPKVEKLGEEDGGQILGYPTRRHRYRTSYSMTVKVFGMGRAQAIVSEDDVWMTDKLSDKAFGVWLRAEPLRTGNAQLDKLIDAETSKAQGFALKRVMTQTATDKGGKATKTTTTMTVDLLESANPPASAFEIPAGYEETEMPLAGMMRPAA